MKPDNTFKLDCRISQAETRQQLKSLRLSAPHKEKEARKKAEPTELVKLRKKMANAKIKNVKRSEVEEYEE